MEALDDDHYRYDNGAGIQESSSLEAIARNTGVTDVRPGMRVLEIGTGSGYTGALLSRLVGPSGWVVSVDVNPRLVERARRLHSEDGFENIVVVLADGLTGCPDLAPFDRVVAWARPPYLPTTWLEQLAPGGVVVASLPTRPDVLGGLTFIIDVVSGTPSVRSMLPGTFVPFHGPGGWHPGLLPTPGAATLADLGDVRPELVWSSGVWGVQLLAR